jgi:hypothetical protein
MNRLATIATVGLIACANADAKADAKEAAEIIAGLMMGVVQSDDLAAIEACMQDGSNVLPEIQEAVSDFEKGGVTNYVKGFEAVVKISKVLPADLKDCKAISGDLERMEKWAAQFKHPWTVGEKILKNTVEHFTEVKNNVEKAVTDYKGAQYYNFGEMIGDTMIVLVGPAPAQATMIEEIKLPKLPVVQIKEALQFLGGVTEQLIKSDDLVNTENCIKDAETLETAVAQTMADFKQKTMSGYLDGIKTLGTALMAVPNDASQCKQMKNDIPKIKAFFAQFKDPEAEVKTIAKNLWNNFDAFKSFTETAEAAYDKKDFSATGAAVGKAMWLVLEGGENSGPLV